MKMQKKAEKSRRKEGREKESCRSIVLINTRKKVFVTGCDRSTTCVNGSPITIQKTDKNTEPKKSMDEKS